ncbi:ADP-ribose pyrophosphatase YjhB (NUDIX family) [Evansella vedderi]|uniref:ADP-ribose pyrophosphatase YjhB (NUDIX family) n=1 Tax=Evansella vedderi TaxID=38282 RepID=A0ABT9ZRQ6_9BACI|nr:NUDIX domain-containing protein [Evansella vedderi]MDQ0253554.1 ADP-ribose pyrophosphatase YjhB (NUDIX family) [Evansella vedderi]
MFEYTICFIRQGENILLLNREKNAWMGAWNGVGGKINREETPLDCIIREVKEETGIELEIDRVKYKGDVTWTNPKGSYYGGMHLFIADLQEEYAFPTPIKVEEGILD